MFFFGLLDYRVNWVVLCSENKSWTNDSGALYLRVVENKKTIFKRKIWRPSFNQRSRQQRRHFLFVAKCAFPRKQLCSFARASSFPKQTLNVRKTFRRCYAKPHVDQCFCYISGRFARLFDDRLWRCTRV